MDTSSNSAASANQGELFTQPTPTTRRLVLEYVNGDWAGVHQIFGLYAGTPPGYIHGPFQVGGESPVIEFASLVRVGHRFAHYREVFDRSTLTGRFDDYMPGNRVGGFDPRQA